MKQQRTVIEDLIFFIRNGVIDFKNYFIPLNAISYVNLIATKGRNALSIEINSGRVFILQQNDVQFLTDFMNILKSCHDNPQVSYKIDVLRGVIYCNSAAKESEVLSDSIPAHPKDLIIPTHILSDLKDLQKNRASTPASVSSAPLPKAKLQKTSYSSRIPKATAFETRSAESPSVSKPAAFETLGQESVYTQDTISPFKETPNRHPHSKLPVPGTGSGNLEHAPIGSGLTAMEIYANKNTSASIPKAPAVPHSTIQAPHTTAQTAHANFKKPSSPISIPKVEAPQRSQNFPRYYSASEFLRKHGELSDASDGTLTPYPDAPPSMINEPKTPKLTSKDIVPNTSTLTLSDKEWTDTEFYFFQKKTSYSKTDSFYQLCEQLEDYAYKKDKDGLCTCLHEMPADKLPEIIDKKTIEQLPLLRKILRENISETES